MNQLPPQNDIDYVLSFFEISIGGMKLGRILFKLFADVVLGPPKSSRH